VSGAGIEASELRARLLRACTQVLAARQRLSALDGAAGDGDLGESLAIGFGAIERALGEAPSEVDIGELLTLTGRTLSAAAPSTFGTLLGLAWRDAGRALAGRSVLDAEDVARMLEAMAGGVAKRGNVTVGQRTVLDALDASHRAALGSGVATAADALNAAADGAAEGAAATAAMRPQVGRAGWIADRAMGHPDAGATAWAVIAAGIAGRETEL